MMHRTKLKRLDKYILLILLSLLCVGCSKKADSTPALTAKDLIEPAASQGATFRVFYGDIEDAEVLDARVSPSVKYLSFDQSVIFGEYSYGIGEAVKKNDVIAKSYNKDTQKAVTDLQAQLQSMKDKYHYEQLTDQNQVDILGYRLQSMKGLAKQQDIISTKAQLDRMKLALRQSIEMEALEVRNLTNQIADLREQYSSCNIIAPFNGVIVGLLPEIVGNRVSNTEKTVAIANNNDAVIQTKYIPQSTISGYDSIYALINGTKYDIEYSPYDNSEYKSLIAAGETPVGNFTFKDSTNDKLVGSYAVIVLVKKAKDHVLCVPNGAISADTQGKFVYKSEGENKVRCAVETGLSDGIYTEITSGLSEGDIIFSNDNGNNSDVSDKAIVKGDFSKDFQAKAEKVWLKEKALTFDPGDSKLIFDSYAVKAGDTVSEGQVIAYVTSENDDVALAEKKFQLDSLIKKSQEIKNGYQTTLTAKESEAKKLTLNSDIKIKKAEIAQLKEDYQYQSAELTKQIIKLRKDIDKTSSTQEMTGIKATEDCFISQLGKLSEGDTITPTTIIVQTADKEAYYLAVDDKDGALIYNMRVTVTDGDQETDGVVVSTWNDSLPAALQNKTAFIRVSNKDVLTHNKVDIKAACNVMKKVVLIDRAYIFTYNDQNYVKELESDGRSIRRVFLAGGYNQQYCWSASDLGEDMKLIKNMDK